MGEEGELPVTVIYDDVISTDGFERDGNGTRSCARHVLRNAVFRFDHDALGYGEDLIAVRVIASVLRRITAERPAGRVKLQEVRAEALADRHLSVEPDERAAVAGHVRETVRRRPLAAERGANQCDAPVDGNDRAGQHLRARVR